MFQNQIEIETHSSLQREITFSPKGASGRTRDAHAGWCFPLRWEGTNRALIHSLLEFLVLSTLMVRKQNDWLLLLAGR